MIPNRNAGWIARSSLRVAGDAHAFTPGADSEKCATCQNLRGHPNHEQADPYTDTKYRRPSEDAAKKEREQQ